MARCQVFNGVFVDDTALIKRIVYNVCSGLIPGFRRLMVGVLAVSKVCLHAAERSIDIIVKGGCCLVSVLASNVIFDGIRRFQSAFITCADCLQCDYKFFRIELFPRVGEGFNRLPCRCKPRFYLFLLHAFGLERGNGLACKVGKFGNATLRVCSAYLKYRYKNSRVEPGI